jgi:hypothetical protein
LPNVAVQNVDFNTADAIQADLIAAGYRRARWIEGMGELMETFGDYNGTGNNAGPGRRGFSQRP